MNIFISYSSKEYTRADRIRALLSQNGFSCWMAPESILSGSDYTTEIPKAIGGADAVVLLLSKNSDRSVWVKSEIALAKEKRNKPIIPFYLEEFMPGKEFAFTVKSERRIDAFVSGNDPERELVEMLFCLSPDETGAEYYPLIHYRPRILKNENEKEKKKKSKFFLVFQILASVLLTLLIAFVILTMAIDSWRYHFFNGNNSDGILGDCTWVYNPERCELTLEGSGSTGDYYKLSGYEAEGTNAECKKIIIKDGVTELGDYVFDSFTALEEVEIPKSVTQIGEGTFRKCGKLRKITVSSSNPSYCSYQDSLYSKEKDELIRYACGYGKQSSSFPSSLKTVAPYAFSSAVAMETLSLPDAVEMIGENAFETCESLRTLSLGEGVRDLPDGLFFTCPALTEITVAKENLFYASDDGVLCSKDRTALTAYPRGRSETSYTIADSVQTIEAYAFSGASNLKEVVLPDELISIGEYAFSNCADLIKVTLPESLQKIGDYAIAYSAVTTIDIPANVREIGACPFLGCYNLMGIYVDDSNSEYLSLDGALYTKELDTFIEYPLGRNAASVTVAEGVRTIGESAFYDSYLLKSISLPSGLEVIGSGAFGCCSDLLSMELPDSVTEIGEGVFYSCKSLVKVNIPEQIIVLPKNLFSGCVSLSRVELPDRLTEIGSTAFIDCESLEEVLMHDGIQKIGYQAFLNCGKLSSLYIPPSVTDIEEEAVGYLIEVNVLNKPYEDFVIEGEKGSEAERYARENGFSFQSVE